MKKILEKIVSITLGFIALLFVILMLVIMFKPEYAANLNNPFVHVLLIIFSVIFGTLTFINIFSAFSDSEKINNVLLFKSKASATKATISVVHKTAKQATKLVSGAKLKKVTLFVDENNDLKIRLDLKVEGADVESTVNAVRATVITTFSEVLGLDFATIDFRLTKLKNEYQPDKAKVDSKIEEYKKEIALEKSLKAEQEKDKELDDNKTAEVGEEQTVTDSADVDSLTITEENNAVNADEVVAADIDNDQPQPADEAVVNQNTEQQEKE